MRASTYITGVGTSSWEVAGGWLLSTVWPVWWGMGSRSVDVGLNQPVFNFAATVREIASDMQSAGDREVEEAFLFDNP